GGAGESGVPGWPGARGPPAGPHRKACDWPAGGDEAPTPCPNLLGAAGIERAPPRVPMSSIPPLCVHEKAWEVIPSSTGLETPTTWPDGLTRVGIVDLLPSVPSETSPPLLVHENAYASSPSVVQ